MFLFLTGEHDKPNRLETKNKDTNEEYHIKYAKYCISNASGSQHWEFLQKAYVNEMFYQGKQWLYKEDLEAFLKDDTMQDRNRIQIVHNIIRPMIEQYRGNAIRIVYNARAKAGSPLAVTRREKELGKQLIRTEIANEVPEFGDFLRNNFPIGEDESETEQIFENLYVDDYVKRMNYLLHFSRDLNDYTAMQLILAQSMGLSGLAVSEGFAYGGHWRTEAFDSKEFFFDRAAKKPDLSDCEYQGRVKPMGGADIYEAFQNITADQRKDLEAYFTGKQADSTYGIGHTAPTTVPVYSVYWKDTNSYEYGYVKDEYGYDYLTKINFIEPGEDTPRYTDKDLIDPPNSKKNDQIFKGEKKTRMFVDELRYCKLIPGDFVTLKNSGEKAKDIALEWGVYEYQDTDYLDLVNVKFPFNCHTWGYVDGQIMSPVDDALNPQRFINRILSVTESQINASGGSNIVYDKDSVSGHEGESQLLRDIAQGKPVGVRGKGLGIPNTVGAYDATPKTGTYNMFNIVSSMKQLVQETTGVNEALKGESTGSDQLVGVTELLIQRGSLMQEPFYYAIERILLQCYQQVATLGKRFYIDNERELSIIIGDDGIDTFTLSEDMKPEDFRVAIKRDNDETVLINAGNNLLLTLKEAQLLDDQKFANLFNRATPDDVASALRKQAKENIELARLQQRQENEAVAIEEGQVREELRQQRLAEMSAKAEARSQDERDKLHDIDLATIKAVGGSGQIGQRV